MEALVGITFLIPVMLFFVVTIIVLEVWWKIRGIAVIHCAFLPALVAAPTVAGTLVWLWMRFVTRQGGGEMAGVMFAVLRMTIPAATLVAGGLAGLLYMVRRKPLFSWSGTR